MRYPVSNTGKKEEFEKFWYNAQPFGAVTSYGFHEGEDWNLRTGGDSDLGQEVKAIASGTMVYYHFSSHPTTGFGRHSVYKINGPWGTRWIHQSHLSDQDFKTSGDVTEGQIIGRVGKSGTPYAHLHFAIYKVDPVAFGIDKFARNQTELNQYWEDPTAFIEKWMTVTPSPVEPVITMQTKIPQIGNMEVQAIIGVMGDKDREITSLKGKLTSGATQLRELANSFEN